MNRTDRLYGIAEELRVAGRRGRTGHWLARRFEVSTRTIKRDVSALQHAGVPVWAQPGPGGGYVLDRAASLPPLNFTSAEAVALALALAAGPTLPLAADGRNALAKVLAAMPPAERDASARLAARIWLRGVAAPARPPSARVLDEALRRGVVVALDYRNADGRESSRAVEPVALAHTGGHWYLVGHCRAAGAARWFRTDRIGAVRLTSEPAPRHDPATFAGTPPSDATPVAVPAHPDIKRG